MLKKLTRFYHPKTIEEACQFLGNGEGRTAVIAGGTSAALRADSSLEALVDISHISELNYINKDAAFYRIGACTRVQDIYKSPDLKGPAGKLLQAAAGKIGSTLLRNAITAGGNLAGLFPWSDLPVAYMALDAEVVCRRGRPKRTVPVMSLIETRAPQFLAANEIIAEIIVPAYGPGTGTAFAKLAKTANDYAIISLAVRLTLKEGVVNQARIAVNAITAQPVRCLEAEKLLEGNALSEELIAEAANKATDSINIRKDIRASEEYRREVFAVMLRRALTEAFENADRKGGQQ